MIGINRATGRPITGVQHIKQSVCDIITTPKQTRVMLREYGCGIFSLIDNPISPEFKIRAIAEVYKSITKYEPRLILKKVDVSIVEQNKVLVSIHGIIKNSGEKYSQELNIYHEQLYRN